MEPENFSQEEVQVKQKSPLHQVTALSKYLALVLFIALPFLGGYVGYVYAPDKKVEVERVVIKEIFNDSSDGTLPEQAIKVEENISPVETVSCKTNLAPYGSKKCYSFLHTFDLDELFYEEIAVKALNNKIRLLELVYFSTSNQVAYFETGIPGSGGCCGLVSYDVEENKFETDSRYTSRSLSSFSDDNRFLVNVHSDGTELSVYDLETDGLVYSFAPATGTLIACEESCGMDGSSTNIDINNETLEVTFGVYSMNGAIDDTVPARSMVNDLLETKTVNLNDHL